MTLGESPAVARRRLRLALRKAREENGFTQGQVASALDWSLSKVQRIESGDVAVSTTDLMALLSHFGIDDTKQKAQLQSIAKISRRKAWWDDPPYRDHLTDGTAQLIAFESEAAVIRVFHPSLVPGLAQTVAYAQYTLDFWSDELSPAERAIRLEVRMRRQKDVFERADPPRYLVVLDESVLLREIGSPQVMAEQLEKLLRLMEMPSVIVRIVPLHFAAMAMMTMFTLVDLDDEENAILYREATLVDEVVDTPDKIRLYRGRFENLWKLALSPESSRELIEKHAEGMLRRT